MRAKKWKKITIFLKIIHLSFYSSPTIRKIRELVHLYLLVVKNWYAKIQIKRRYVFERRDLRRVCLYIKWRNLPSKALCYFVERVKLVTRFNRKWLVACVHINVIPVYSAVEMRKMFLGKKGKENIHLTCGEIGPWTCMYICAVIYCIGLMLRINLEFFDVSAGRHFVVKIDTKV